MNMTLNVLACSSPFVALITKPKKSKRLIFKLSSDHGVSLLDYIKVKLMLM